MIRCNNFQLTLDSKLTRFFSSFQIIALWLSNTLRFVDNLKQYSGEKQFQTECTLKQMDQSLRRFELSEQSQAFSDVAISIYKVNDSLILVDHVSNCCSCKFVTSSFRLISICVRTGKNMKYLKWDKFFFL